MATLQKSYYIFATLEIFSPKPYPAQHLIQFDTKKEKLMSSELIIHTTDANFEQDVFEIRRTRIAGLLGTLVRPLQNDRSDLGRHRRRI